MVFPTLLESHYSTHQKPFHVLLAQEGLIQRLKLKTRPLLSHTDFLLPQQSSGGPEFGQ